MLTTTIMMSVATVAAFLITLSRVIGWRRVFRYGTLIDVAFTLTALVVFGDTLTGALIAVVSGLLMALFISAARWIAKRAEQAEKSAPRRPGGIYADEYDADGVWLYNKTPYV